MEFASLWHADYICDTRYRRASWQAVYIAFCRELQTSRKRSEAPATMSLRNSSWMDSLYSYIGFWSWPVERRTWGGHKLLQLLIHTTDFWPTLSDRFSITGANLTKFASTLSLNACYRWKQSPPMQPISSRKAIDPHRKRNHAGFFIY
jgi:hypothetical protein